MHKERKSKLYLLILLVGSFILSYSYFSKNALHIPQGDGFEYVMMTEAFSNHATPDIRKIDIERYLDYHEKHNLKLYSESKHRSSLVYLDEEESFYGYYKSPKNNKFYAYHFWTVSLFAVPFRVLLEFFSLDIRTAFLMLNLFLIHLAAWIIFSLSILKRRDKVFGVLFLAFSPLAWYIHWPHSEVLSGVFCFLGVLLFFDNRKYLSLLLLSLATTQAQPIVVPTLFVFINILFTEKRDINSLLKLFFSSVWVVIPLIFYYYLFSKPSLNFGNSFTDFNYVSLSRLYSYFYDLNQGIIIGIPLGLFVLKGFMIRDIIIEKINFFLKTYPFVISLLLMSPLFMITVNWNHGSSVINRYAVWGTSLLFASLFYRLSILNLKSKVALYSTIIVVQIFTIISQIEYNKNIWYSSKLNALSKAVLYKFPSFYSPDPQIFIARTYSNRPMYMQELSSTDSIMTFTDNNYRIKKILIREGGINQLVLRGISQDKVDSLRSVLKYEFGYTYMNIKELEEIGYSQSNDTLIHFIEQEKFNKLKLDYLKTNRTKDISEKELIKNYQKELKEYRNQLYREKQIDIL